MHISEISKSGMISAKLLTAVPLRKRQQHKYKLLLRPHIPVSIFKWQHICVIYLNSYAHCTFPNLFHANAEPRPQWRAICECRQGGGPQTLSSGRDGEGGSSWERTLPAMQQQPPQSPQSAHTQNKTGTLKHKDEYSQLKMSGQGEVGIIQRTNRKLRDTTDIPRSNNFHPRGITEKKNWGKKREK